MIVHQYSVIRDQFTVEYPVACRAVRTGLEQ